MLHLCCAFTGQISPSFLVLNLHIRILELDYSFLCKQQDNRILHVLYMGSTSRDGSFQSTKLRDKESPNEFLGIIILINMGEFPVPRDYV